MRDRGAKCSEGSFGRAADPTSICSDGDASLAAIGARMRAELMPIKKRPPRHWKIGAAAALALGLALTAGVVAHVGAGALGQAARAVGWGGFALYALVSALIFLPLGLAWKAAAPAVPARMFLAFVWGRIMREAASDILPLAQVTGLFIGVRAVGRRGISEASVVGSLIIDLTTEMAAQVLYTLFGVSMLVATLAHVTDARDLLAAALLALLLGVGVLAVFVLLQGAGRRPHGTPRRTLDRGDARQGGRDPR